jgi:hypothetical protein
MVSESLPCGLVVGKSLISLFIVVEKSVYRRRHKYAANVGNARARLLLCCGDNPPIHEQIPKRRSLQSYASSVSGDCTGNSVLSCGPILVRDAAMMCLLSDYLMKTVFAVARLPLTQEAAGSSPVVLRQFVRRRATG